MEIDQSLADLVENVGYFVLLEKRNYDSLQVWDWVKPIVAPSAMAAASAAGSWRALPQSLPRTAPWPARSGRPLWRHEQRSQEKDSISQTRNLMNHSSYQQIILKKRHTVENYFPNVKLQRSRERYCRTLFKISIELPQDLNWKVCFLERKTRQ